ncbi:unnamed protein product [Mycena citricolor]|uniref:Rap-GAP domain-containing protein n=1 Tax=Mycena citricolor TaxID=2018698 RepID=A0AAD2JVJ8_9AGAR|nr:unnamed protein product [Mycena citricolor]
MAKFMSPILEKLSQIMSNANMAVHILAFLVIISSQPRLYANFIEHDFRLVFGVALQYLQHQNRNRDDQSVSWTLSEYVRILSYYNVYVWFLAIKLPDRPKHITYILRQLELANEDNSGPDDSTIVCCDWLERYTYASADPRPAASVLSEIVMNPSEPAEEAIQEKTWAMGNSIVTVRTLKRRGWFEVLSRRPSGFTKMLCRLENSPLVGPGDVDPDLVSVPAALVMEREGQLPPGEPGVQGDDLTPKPDSITGYVWSGTAPSQRRKAVEIDPSFFILQMSDGSKSDRHLLNDDKKLRSLCSALDRLPVIDTHKVGILYVAPGQTNELEILANTHGSPAYTRFLEGIGRLIDLRGQVDVYVGGLEPGLDGDYAYAWWDDIGQILYHAATMMPTNQDDPQLINKKRNIGNDYVRIVWNDSGIPYRFDTLSTQFQFVNIVIEPHSLGPIAAFSDNLHEIEYFKVTVQRAEKMADFAPVGCFKLISSKSLPLLIRQLSLLADWFASVYAHTESDTVRTEVVTNWQSRLQTIRRYHDQNLPGREVGDEPFRDFTAQF